MVTTYVELEIAQQLKEAGKLLSDPPTSVDELLHILDQTEKLLSKVDQSPNTSMLEAFRPSMTALVDERFLNHSNIDVKVAVAACLCEITRITAPDAPFNDDEMKGVFQLIVSSFENLSDKSSRSYSKRASILDTVSNVRSCVIMLDLECEELIVEMFEHFLKPVTDHPEDILSSMVNIISLVLEESEDISDDILKPLLASIKNNTEGALPVVRKLGERVLKRCAATLKPFLIKTLRNLGDSLDNYSQVLASICEGTTDVEHKDETTLVQRQADERKLTSASSDNTTRVVIGNAETDATFDATLKSLRSDVRKVSGNEGGSADKESSKKLEEAINPPDPNPDPTSKLDTDESVAKKLAKVDSKPERTSKRRGNKTDTTLKSATPSDSTHGYDENKIDKDTDVPKAIESEVGDAPSESGSLPDEKYVKKDNLPKEHKATNADVLSRSGSIPCKSRTKRAGWSKKKSTGQENTPSMEVVLTTAPEGMSDIDMKSPKRARKKATFAREDKIPAAIATMEDSKATGDLESKHLKTSSKKVDTIDPESKPEKRSGKKVGGVDSLAKKHKLSGKKTDAGDSETNKSKKASTEDYESDSDAKPLKDFNGMKEKMRLITKPSEHTVNREEGSNSDTPSHKTSSKKDDRSSSALVKSSSKKRKGKEKKNNKNVEEKDQTKSLPEVDGVDVSPKSAVKTATEESDWEETLVTASKRKRAVSKENVTIKYDDSLVGEKVKIWWPLDKMYYEGEIVSFDSAKKQHTVLYLDNEIELLNLKKEKWDILKDTSGHNEDISAEVTRGDETPKKKSKTSQDKPKDSAKRAGGASLSRKSKGPTSNSSASSKGVGKVGIKSTSQKNSGKSVKSASSKDSGISKEDDVQLFKMIPKKEETLKLVYKSKRKTAESGNEDDSINPKLPESISVNVKESEDADAVEDPASPKGKAAVKTTKKRGNKRKKRT